MIESTEDYGIYKNGSFTPSQKLKIITSNFFKEIISQKSCMFIVNEKKVLLQQIYKNLVNEFKNHLPVQVEYIDSLPAGTFTNYEVSCFKEPDSVFVLLTRKYNSKELRVLDQLKKTNIKVYVLTLGIRYYYEKFTVVNVDKIKSLYWFMYTLLSLNNVFSYSQFLQWFVITTQRHDFKE